MKRIDMATGEPAHLNIRPIDPADGDARQPERFDSALSEALQVDLTYAFWTSLFAVPQADLRERMTELDDLRRDNMGTVEQGRLDAASHAIAFVLRTKAAMPEAGVTLL